MASRYLYARNRQWRLLPSPYTTPQDLSLLLYEAALLPPPLVQPSLVQRRAFVRRRVSPQVSTVHRSVYYSVKLANSFPILVRIITSVKPVRPILSTTHSAASMIVPVHVSSRMELPYENINELGRGTFGKVLQVRNQTRNYLALKYMLTTRNSHRSRLETIREEVRNIQALQNHHHFIRVHDAYETDHEVGFIYEPVANGGSLESCIDKVLRNPSSASELRIDFNRAYGCLVSGLAFMHDNNIRHKDIKPANILVHQGRVIVSLDSSDAITCILTSFGDSKIVILAFRTTLPKL
jgi:serine/threonine protein kinase